MNAHERALELGAARLDFALSGGERRALDAHLASCAVCRRQLTGMADDARRLESRPARRMPPTAAAAVRTRLERPPRAMSPAMALVAAVLVMLAVLATLAVGAEIQRRIEDGRLAVVPIPTTVPVSPVPSPPPTPAASKSPSLAWTTVAEPDLRPKRGFEHGFLDSARGTMIQVRHLEGELTTIVASTRDGVTWTTNEVPSDTVPAGQAVNGGDDWMQLVARNNGRLQLVASTDGLTWERRGVLPEAIGALWDSAVNGTTIVVCGSGVGPREGRAECARSADDGTTWTLLADLGAAIDMASICDVVPLGTGFLLIAEGQDAGTSVALTSADGVTWTRQPEPVPNRATAVGVVGDTVIAYGATDTAASMAATRDGVTWETVAMPAMEGWVDEFVRVGDVVVGPVTQSQPEGAAFASGFLLSADGRTWVVDEPPAEMAMWQSPTFLGVEDGLVALGGEAGMMMLGRVTAADVP